MNKHILSNPHSYQARYISVSTYRILLSVILILLIINKYTYLSLAVFIIKFVYDYAMYVHIQTACANSFRKLIIINKFDNFALHLLYLLNINKIFIIYKQWLNDYVNFVSTYKLNDAPNIYLSLTEINKLEKKDKVFRYVDIFLPMFLILLISEEFAWLFNRYNVFFYSLIILLSVLYLFSNYHTTVSKFTLIPISINPTYLYLCLLYQDNEDIFIEYQKTLYSTDKEKKIHSKIIPFKFF